MSVPKSERGNANNVRIVNTTGAGDGNYASNSGGVAPDLRVKTD